MTSHEQFKEWLLLSHYGEIARAEKALLAKHLASCAECRAEQRALKKFHRVLAAHAPVKSTAEMLNDARNRLRVAVHLEQSRRFWLERTAEAIANLVPRRYNVALAAAAMLVVGIGVGYFVLQPSAPSPALGFRTAGTTETALSQGETEISNVQIITRDPVTGEVEFTFDSVTPVRIRGNMSDEHVQKVLARALVDDRNPGMRLRAVNAISEHSGKQQPMGAEVKAAVIAAVKHDHNLGVRQEALKALEQYLPDAEATEAILYVLKHENNTGMRIAAINSLEPSKFAAGSTRDLLLNGLRDRVTADENNYVRIKAKAALEEVKAP